MKQSRRLRLGAAISLVLGLTLLSFQNCSSNLRFDSVSSSEMSSSSPSATTTSGQEAIPATSSKLNFLCQNVTQNSTFSKNVVVGPGEDIYCQFESTQSSSIVSQTFDDETGLEVTQAPQPLAELFKYGWAQMQGGKSGSNSESNLKSKYEYRSKNNYSKTKHFKVQLKDSESVDSVILTYIGSSNSVQSINFMCQNLSVPGSAPSRNVVVGPNEVIHCEALYFSELTGRSYDLDSKLYDSSKPLSVASLQTYGWKMGTNALGQSVLIYEKKNESQVNVHAKAILYLKTATTDLVEDVEITYKAIGSQSSVEKNVGAICRPTEIGAIAVFGIVGTIDKTGKCSNTVCDSVQGYIHLAESDKDGNALRCYKCHGQGSQTWGGAEGLLSCQSSRSVFANTLTVLGSAGFNSAIGEGNYPLSCENGILVDDKNNKPSCTAYYYFRSLTGSASTQSTANVKLLETYDPNICQTVHKTRCQKVYDLPPSSSYTGWQVTCACDSM